MPKRRQPSIDLEAIENGLAAGGLFQSSEFFLFVFNNVKNERERIGANRKINNGIECSPYAFFCKFENK